MNQPRQDRATEAALERMREQLDIKLAGGGLADSKNVPTPAPLFPEAALDRMRDHLGIKFAGDEPADSKQPEPTPWPHPAGPFENSVVKLGDIIK